MIMSSEYLCIEPFIRDALAGRMLQAAFELGVIDRLANRTVCAADQLFRRLPLDRHGAELLRQTLENNGVLASDDVGIRLTDSFRRTLPFRDLMLTKLQFAELFATDYVTRLPQLLQSEEDFMRTAKLFELFDYSRCHEVTPENCIQTARWMKLTTALTRYEAPVCCDHFNFSQSRRMLDLGGNSGEFARQVCERTPHLHVTVGDLPVVCHVGREHLSGTEEAARIQFQPLHFLNESLPSGYDLISFKSVLHDWPEEAVRILLTRCRDALAPGGRVLIFERTSIDFRSSGMSYGQLPVLLFFRSYRPAESYAQFLSEAGFRNMELQLIPLDVPFLLMTAEA
ncbi:MAG: methyltransferase [Planctomycetaceae bacterium]|nr:methyltransferase [Planctomycetaceae bacterium]